MNSLWSLCGCRAGEKDKEDVTHISKLSIGVCKIEGRGCTVLQEASEATPKTRDTFEDALKCNCKLLFAILNLKSQDLFPFALAVWSNITSVPCGQEDQRAANLSA